MLWHVLYAFRWFCSFFDGFGLLQTVLVGSDPSCRWFFFEFRLSLDAALLIWPVLVGSCQFRIVVEWLWHVFYSGWLWHVLYGSWWFCTVWDGLGMFQTVVQGSCLTIG